MLKKITFLLLMLISHVSGFGCINEYTTLLSGKVVMQDTDGKIYIPDIDTVAYRLKADELLLTYQKTNSQEVLSDYAAALVYLGEYKSAKKIYLNIEHMTPHLYTTASNLGTIYELTGQPDSALFWIKKSVEINPDSHYGSEWIHIKILEYKLSNDKDPSKSILGLDFGSDTDPKNINEYDLKELEYHIRHQLTERMAFVKPENVIVGNIFFDLGNVVAQTWNVQSGIQSYNEAIRYGFNSELMETRMSHFKMLSLRTMPYEVTRNTLDDILYKHRWIVWLILALGALLSFILVRWFLIKSKRS